MPMRNTPQIFDLSGVRGRRIQSLQRFYGTYWPPTLQTSSTLVKEPLKSLKSHTVTVEMETPRRAPVGESVVVDGLELIGFITGAAGRVAAFDVEPVVPLD